MNKNPILSKEAINMKERFSNLISSHNTLCAICEVFDKNDIAKQYFEYGKYEVLESGNAGLSQMYVVAITRMCEFIKEHSEENPDIDRLRLKLYALENKNRMLENKLNSIYKIFNKEE